MPAADRRSFGGEQLHWPATVSIRSRRSRPMWGFSESFLRRWMAQYDVVTGRWEGLTSDEPRRRTRVLELATAAAGNRAVPLSLER
jgi:hypothetical protein